MIPCYLLTKVNFVKDINLTFDSKLLFGVHIHIIRVVKKYIFPIKEQLNIEDLMFLWRIFKGSADLRNNAHKFAGNQIILG